LGTFLGLVVGFNYVNNKFLKKVLKKSTGTIVGPAEFSGPSLAEVLELAGGITPEDAIEITASDGYVMTLS